MVQGSWRSKDSPFGAFPSEYVRPSNLGLLGSQSNPSITLQKGGHVVLKITVKDYCHESIPAGGSVMDHISAKTLEFA
ncbi:hypothetical protein AK812_SmicGene24630 [Symbiodinium microadriaticum]|uniref:Uncharacterized protein n=1 Tax=Symbiodinium microadriaticum TaxID=2951 RepID=A0A1Q9DEA5_SYMMI|nr:hypothetical protein AK812_SmicGene24630 [Symbiodinium microadriaticum]